MLATRMYQLNKKENSSQPNTADLVGSQGKIYCQTILSDDLLATGGDDGTINIWNLKTNKVERTLNKHFGPVTALLKLNDDWLASGSADTSIYIWNWKEGIRLKSQVGHTGPIKKLIHLPDHRIASCGELDLPIFIWDYKKAVEHVMQDYHIKVLVGHEFGVNSLVPLDHKHIVSVDTRGVTRLWNAMTYQCESIYDTGHPLLGDAISMSNMDFIIGAQGNNIYYWNTRGFPITKIGSQEGEIGSLIMLPDRYLASSSQNCFDQTIKIWNLDNGTCMESIEPPDFVSSLAFHDGCLIAGLNNGTIKRYPIDFAALELKRETQLPESQKFSNF